MSLAQRPCTSPAWGTLIWLTIKPFIPNHALWRRFTTQFRATIWKIGECVLGIFFTCFKHSMRVFINSFFFFFFFKFISELIQLKFPYLWNNVLLFRLICNQCCFKPAEYFMFFSPQEHLMCVCLADLLFFLFFFFFFFFLNQCTDCMKQYKTRSVCSTVLLCLVGSWHLAEGLLSVNRDEPSTLYRNRNNVKVAQIVSCTKSVTQLYKISL